MGLQNKQHRRSGMRARPALLCNFAQAIINVFGSAAGTITQRRVIRRWRSMRTTQLIGISTTGASSVRNSLPTSSLNHYGSRQHYAAFLFSLLTVSLLAAELHP